MRKRRRGHSRPRGRREPGRRPRLRPRPCRSSPMPRPRPAQSTVAPAPLVRLGVARVRARPRRRGRLVQVLADEAVDVAVEDALRVPDLEPGAMVLHPLVRMEEIATDLRAPLRRLLLATFPGELLGALKLLSLEQAGAQDLHRCRLV